MTANEPSGPVRVGYAVLGGDDTRLYQTEKRARYYAGFNGRVAPVYTLPDNPVAARQPAVLIRLRWFLFGMAVAALVIGVGAA